MVLMNIDWKLFPSKFLIITNSLKGSSALKRPNIAKPEIINSAFLMLHGKSIRWFMKNKGKLYQKQHQVWP